MIIEQDAQQAKNSFMLSVNAELHDLRLGEATIWSIGPFDEEMAKGELSSELRFRPAALKELANSIFMSIEFLFRIVVGTEELVRIACRFDAEYKLRNDFHPTKEQVEAFHHGNAIFNCWPFFREFVQNTTSRLNYPSAPVPFLRLMPKRPGEGSLTVPTERTIAATKKRTEKKLRA